MQTHFVKQAAAMFLFSLAGAAYAQQPEPAVAVKTEGMPPHVAAKVKEKAAQGTSALRRYVSDTRMVNGLHLASIVRR